MDAPGDKMSIGLGQTNEWGVIGMSFWVMENIKYNYIMIHIGECWCCQNGHDPWGGRSRLWLGPFATYEEAEAQAQKTGKLVDNCGRCNPQSSK